MKQRKPNSNDFNRSKPNSIHSNRVEGFNNIFFRFPHKRKSFMKLKLCALLFSSWGSYLAHYIGNFVLALWLPTMSCAVTSGCWKTYWSCSRREKMVPWASRMSLLKVQVQGSGPRSMPRSQLQSLVGDLSKPKEPHWNSAPSIPLPLKNNLIKIVANSTKITIKNTKCTHTPRIRIGKVEHCLLEIFACFSIDTDNYTEFQKFQKQYLSKSQIEGCYYLWMYW